MSNTEWWLLIAAGVTIDIVQLGLDALLIGPFVNWLIDALVYMSLYLIYHLQGVKMDKKKWFTLAAGFIFDALGVGALPLWGADIFAVMLMDKADKKLPKLPI